MALKKKLTEWHHPLCVGAHSGTIEGTTVHLFGMQSELVEKFEESDDEEGVRRRTETITWRIDDKVDTWTRRPVKGEQDEDDEEL